MDYVTYYGLFEFVMMLCTVITLAVLLVQKK